MNLTNQTVISQIHEALQVSADEFLNVIQFPDTLIKEINNENIIVTVIAIHRFGLRSSIWALALWAAERLDKIAMPVAECSEIEIEALRLYDQDWMETLNPHLEEFEGATKIIRDAEMNIGVLCYILKVPKELMGGIDKTDEVAISSNYLSKIQEDQLVYSILALQNYAANRGLFELIKYLNDMLEKEYKEKGSDLFNDQELLYMVSVNANIVSVNAKIMGEIQKISAGKPEEGSFNTFDADPTIQ